MKLQGVLKKFEPCDGYTNVTFRVPSDNEETLIQCAMLRGKDAEIGLPAGDGTKRGDVPLAARIMFSHIVLQVLLIGEALGVVTRGDEGEVFLTLNDDAMVESANNSSSACGITEDCADA